MEYTAKIIAEYLNGRIEGNENTTVNTFSKIEDGKPCSITFLSNKKYTHYIYTTKASIVIVDEGLKLEHPVPEGTTLIRVNNAYESIAKLLQLYESTKVQKSGVSDLAFIEENAIYGSDCYIGAFAYIGKNVTIGNNCKIYPHAYIGDDVKIGDNCIIYPNVVIYHQCKLGNRITIHSGSVIGADGFGFAPTPDGYSKIPQIGFVTIEDDVDIGANTCIDRSTMGSTYIRKGVKLDNLVQIAHNNDIGENTVMSAQVGVAGSTKVGKWCMFGGQVGLAGHLTIGDRVMLGAQSGVPNNLEGNQTLIGSPPVPQIQFFRSQAVIHKLPEMYRQLSSMQKKITELENKLNSDKK
jgi:UDP-3-O-[3-hydroxymyristoyl] glucosamine N-acyltransferase